MLFLVFLKLSKHALDQKETSYAHLVRLSPLLQDKGQDSKNKNVKNNQTKGQDP